MSSIDIRADHRQTQSLSPRLQHAVRLLQMSSMDFAAVVQDTLGKNPFLESEEGDGDDTDNASADSPATDTASQDTQPLDSDASDRGADRDSAHRPRRRWRQRHQQRP